MIASKILFRKLPKSPLPSNLNAALPASSRAPSSFKRSALEFANSGRNVPIASLRAVNAPSLANPVFAKACNAAADLLTEPVAKSVNLEIAIDAAEIISLMFVKMFFKAGPSTVSNALATLPMLLTIDVTCDVTVPPRSSVAFSAAPAEFFWLSRLVLNFSKPSLASGKIVATASTLPNNLVSATSLPPVFLITSAKKPPKPFALIAAELNSRPKSCEVLRASSVGLITLAMA